MLYIFAGAARRADVGDWLNQMASAQEFTLHITEVDLLRSGGAAHNNVLDEQFWASLKQRMRSAEWSVLVITPPCNTFSRARYANRNGPRPLRSKGWPWGFPWLEGHNLEACQLGNKFVIMTYEAADLAFELDMGFLIEHPEDLGSTPAGDLPGSIWAMTETFELAKRTGATTASFYQCPFEAETSKPTRFLTTLPLTDPPELKLARGWPRFSAHGAYLGPLPRRCGHRHKPLLGRDQKTGAFVTSAAAAYPARMCFWIATLIVNFCLERPVLKVEESETGLKAQEIAETQDVPAVTRSSSDATAGFTSTTILPEDQDTSEDDEEGIVRPLAKDFKGGVGPPLASKWGGKSKEIHDGAGLCSPGRWIPGKRRRYVWSKLLPLKHKLLATLHKHVKDVPKLCCLLATGKVVDSPFSEELITEAREAWFQALLDSGGKLDEATIRSVPEFQPFFLPALGESLRLLQDPDWRVFFVAQDSYSSGVPVGYNTKMPRTPAVFPRKTRWRNYDESEEKWDMDNYRSAALLGDVLQEQFEAEGALGMMYETTLALAQKDYPGDRLRVAANGAIEKSDSSWRIIHDGTHGVLVNVGIKPRDQQRMPVAGDARAIMEECSASRPGAHFSLDGDISKAHRRYLHRRADWGLQGCRARAATGDLPESKLWINRVGTFGMGSASYWWSRLAAGIQRFAFSFYGLEWFWSLLYADDLHAQSHGATMYTDLLLIFLLWTITGAPFSWRKCRGGLTLDWVGYWLDYSKFDIGISESRAKWLIQWADKILQDGVVLIRQLAQGLGRLGFASGVLEWYRPFLAPIYAWAAAAPGGAVLAIPSMVRLTLNWILKEFKTGRRTTSCKARKANLGLVFKTDAKGEEDFVVLGGWECRGGVGTKSARWYSTRLTKFDAPWLFSKGHGSRTIASSELMASLLAVHLFLPETGDCSGEAATVCTGETDNQGNSYIVQRFLTTKMPVAAVLMQLASMLASRGLWLNLNWTPRLSNTEADALTNEVFTEFDPALRIPVVWHDLPFHVMTSVVADAELFVADLNRAKELKKKSEVAPVDKRFRKRHKVKEPWGV